MKRRFAIIAISLLLLLVLAYLLLKYNSGKLQILLSSDPFPMTIGSSSLKIQVVENGQPIENASLRIITQLAHPGAPEIVYFPYRVMDAMYEVPVVWSMMGQASILVRAELPDNRAVEERFSAFVYLVPPLETNGHSSYRSFDELSRDIASNSAEEYWIVIPQGTREMMLMGMGDEFVPAQIRLNLKGQHTLIIRNDDFADHSIGPFFVRAGEIVRQTFSEVAIIEGTCSVRHNASIRIIVEES
jgi:hypothetical protein